ncbi:MAG: aldehyde ferredoxin oxidoreductase family protein, partial [Dehalococcoidia bacterium]
DEKTDPPGPDNVLIFMTGLLTGTGGPSLTRWIVAARSPYTTFYGDANAGGYFGTELRFSGYDGIIIKGMADKPVYLYIKDGKPELRDASGLWGKKVSETISAIREEHADERTRVACIGQAGENQVLFANIMTENGHCAGRAGMGCVMGSKNLKAIAVRGKAKIPLAEPEKFKEIARSTMEDVKGGFISEYLHALGTCGWVDSGTEFGDVPAKYFTAPPISEIAEISGTTQSETCQVDTTGCFGCPIRCRKVLHIKEGRFKCDRPEEGPEYETLAAWGPMLMINDIGAITHFNTLLNEYGMDSISSGVSTAFAFYLYEKGVINSKDTGGLELKWGDIDAALELLHETGQNRGFGKIIQEGTKRMAARYNRPGESMQVKGLEIPMHDHRAFSCMGLVYATASRGADHNKAGCFVIDQGMGITELNIIPGDRFGDDRAFMVARMQDVSGFNDCLGLCAAAVIIPETLLALINASTGWNMDLDGLVKAGERIFQLMRAMTCKLGVTPKDDQLPEIALRPIQGGRTEGNVPNMAKMLPEYYKIRDWNEVTGKPSKERMGALDMGDLVTVFKIS